MLPQTKRRGSNPFHLPSEVSQQSNEYYMDELCKAIDADLDEMRATISSLGTSTDTIQSRRKFAMLQIEVNQKIMKAAKDNIDFCLHEQYTLSIQKKTDALRSVVELAISEFAKYPPKLASTYDMKESGELTPLLCNLSSSSPVSPSLDSLDYEEYVGVAEDAELREVQTTQSMRSLQNAFDALYAVIHEQELMMLNEQRSNSRADNAVDIDAAMDVYRMRVNGNAMRVANDVDGIGDITAWPMESARARQRRDQRNLIVGLILALITLSVIICYIYFRFIYRK